jgi:Ca2+-binding RTX toxin-like protein
MLDHYSMKVISYELIYHFCFTYDILDKRFDIVLKLGHMIKGTRPTKAASGNNNNLNHNSVINYWKYFAFRQADYVQRKIDRTRLTKPSSDYLENSLSSVRQGLSFRSFSFLLFAGLAVCTITVCAPYPDNVSLLVLAERIRGNSTNDNLTGTLDNDHITGSSGNDTLVGLAGSDEIDGGREIDTISGSEDDDYLIGGAHNDLINGDDGHDEVEGNDGDDKISGGIGNDILLGGRGNDILNGEDGNDLLLGGPRDDTLWWEG